MEGILDLALLLYAERCHQPLRQGYTIDGTAVIVGLACSMIYQITYWYAQ